MGRIDMGARTPYAWALQSLCMRADDRRAGPRIPHTSAVTIVRGSAMSIFAAAMWPPFQGA